jgi:O-acetyl-ADP-ribose deacetylase (regulator of RNase III)
MNDIPNNIYIISNNKNELDAFEKVGFNILHCNVEDITKNYFEEQTVYFVSPANSLLFMDGGIDKAYMNMFKGIQQIVQKKLRTLGAPKTKLGRFYLPVGSGLLTRIDGTNMFLISVPTMFLPQPVNGTKNPYYAMIAILKLWPRDGILLVPPLACGYGKIEPEISAQFMIQAINEYANTDISPNDLWISPNDYSEEQPNYYENLEIKDIVPENIIKK